MINVNQIIYAVTFQVGWFICVKGYNLTALIYTIVVLALHCLHLWWTHNSAVKNPVSYNKFKLTLTEGAWLFIITSFGVALETASFSAGLLYSLAPVAPFKHLILPPLWLICLWLLFAMLLRNSLYVLLSKPKVTYLLTLIFVPLNYYSGAQLNPLVKINTPYFFNLTFIALMWIIFFACLIPIKNAYFKDLFNDH